MARRPASKLSGLKLPEGIADPAFRSALAQRFATDVYGPVPDAIPNQITWEATLSDGADRFAIRCFRGRHTHMVDTCLWRPVVGSPMAVIVVLDFLGPIGCTSANYPIDRDAVICAPGGREGAALSDTMRGATPDRVPVRKLTEAGYAVLVSCYGSWVPDDPECWRQRGLYPLLNTETGALSLWAWAYHRLVEHAKNMFPTSRVVLAGHSRLGKAALWAAATHPDVDAVFANQSGCYGAAPHAHPVGETAAQLVARYPHWVIAKCRPNLDQHLLLALLAPRCVYLGQAEGDLWADPIGSLAALETAQPAWGHRSQRVGAHLRAGTHDLTQLDWDHALRFLAHQWATP